MPSPLLVARVLMVRSPTATLTSCLDPLRVATEAAFKGLVGI